MSDLGDIGAILDSKPLANLDWLEVDEEEYRALERLPQQNLDSVPELEEQWGRLRDEDQYRLSAENQVLESSRQPVEASGMSEEDALAVVEKFARRHVQAGVLPRDLINILKSNFDSTLLSKSKDTIRTVLKERGVLGSVYIDSTLFPGCHNTGSIKGLTANTESAKYVKAKSACADCIHNREGRCSVFQKELILDVEYTQDLWEEYAQRMEREGKDLSHLQGLSVKEKLQRAFLDSTLVAHTPLDNKPRIKDPTEGITYEEALAQVRSADIKQEILEDTRCQKKVRRVAQEMMRGNHGPQVKDLVASDPDLSSLQPKLNLLGRLYADLSYFPTHKAASEFLKSLPVVPPVVVGIPYEEKSLNSRQAQASTLDIRSEAVLSGVVKRYFHSRKGHTAEKEDRLKSVLSSASEKKVMAFIQKVYEIPLPREVRSYEATSIYDPTQGITPDQADVQLLEASMVPQEVVEDPVVDKIKRKLALRMLCGDHDTRVAGVITSDSRLASLRDHLHLLGNLYVDTSLVTFDDITKVAKKRPEVGDLPLLTPNNRDIFFQKPETHAAIAARVATIKDIPEGSKEHLEFVRSLISKLGNADENKVVAIAKKAFSTQVVKRAPMGSDMLEEFEFSVVAKDASLGTLDLVENRDEDPLDLDMRGGLTLE